ncbi:hypothetical protein ILUMI_15599 [Ignelater luminosus]|uniref:Peptidase S1 domain-containing protein n=1 Tax=Ignelater luminosus TaxID=2038154 RepID=A0A8K0CNA0_IGNLU|nr:hypothetical protein ILUMI_15599 [Ignelater luminosus]
MLLTFVIAWLVFNCHSTQSEDERAEDRIVGGTIAGKYQFPFFVQLQIPIKDQGKSWLSICGASLIASQWILTVAHCFPETADEQLELIKNKTLITYMGSNKRFDEKAKTNLLVQVYLHPNFYFHKKPLIILNDIAVAKLTRPYELSRTIQTIAIATQRSQKRCRQGTIVGVGKISSTAVYGIYVRYAKIISKERYEIGDNLKPSDTVFVSKIMKMGKRIHAYSGDSGSPFICYSDNIPVLYGIFSYFRSTPKSVITIFESIDRFTDFILTFVPEVSIYKEQKILKINKTSYFRSPVNKRTAEVVLIIPVLKYLLLREF